MGEVDQPHHAEHEREPGREQGVEAAEQDPWINASSQPVMS